MMESEAKYVKSLSKGTSTSRGQDIALKANKKKKARKLSKNPHQVTMRAIAQVLMMMTWLFS
jgi:hypothetical protein